MQPTEHGGKSKRHAPDLLRMMLSSSMVKQFVFTSLQIENRPKDSVLGHLGIRKCVERVLNRTFTVEYRRAAFIRKRYVESSEGSIWQTTRYFWK